MKGGRVLVVEDERAMRDLLQQGLQARGYQVVAVPDVASAWAKVAAEDFDVVLTDIQMPGSNGLELCQRVVISRPDTPVVLLTAFGSLDAAVSAIRAGAYDFVTKPVELEALDLVLARAVEHRRLRQEVQRLREEAAPIKGAEDWVGESPPLRKAAQLLARVADSDVNVLITGESGTGKEVAARILHSKSRARNGPFVAVNCAAVPAQLLESELFGHVKGAFTDARNARNGLFLQASEGTLLLDEVGELPLDLQPKLLRALQERKVRPVGGDGEVPFDARLVAATNRDLELMVEEGTFREDLFYRLNVVNVELPPLRSRGNDVLLLAQRFVVQFAQRMGKPVQGLTSGAAQKLLNYSWPGNVRELQNCIERAVALTAFDQISVDDLPEKIQDWKQPQPTATSVEMVSLEEAERRHILAVLEAVGGSRTLASRTLQLDRKTLYRKLERWGLGS